MALCPNTLDEMFKDVSDSADEVLAEVLAETGRLKSALTGEDTANIYIRGLDRYCEKIASRIPEHLKGKYTFSWEPDGEDIRFRWRLVN